MVFTFSIYLFLRVSVPLCSIKEARVEFYRLPCEPVRASVLPHTAGGVSYSLPIRRMASSQSSRLPKAVRRR